MWNVKPIASWSLVRAVALIGLAILSSVAQQTALPPPPTKFDVTSIKPVNTARDSSPTNIDHGGLMANNITIRRLIQLAFNIRDYQILNAPDWIDGARYDIVAKADSARDFTDKQMEPLIQNLLDDRFGFRYRRETRNLSGYALVAAKGGPKLKLSESGSGSGTNITNYNSGRVTIEASKMSLARLAVVLEGLLRQPVVNYSGLIGEYDIKLEYDSGLNPDSTMPSLFTVLQGQLGLRLQARKVPVEMIVIKDVRQPSEN